MPNIMSKQYVAHVFFIHRGVLERLLFGGCGKLPEKPHFISADNAGLVFTKAI